MDDESIGTERRPSPQNGSGAGILLVAAFIVIAALVTIGLAVYRHQAAHDEGLDPLSTDIQMMAAFRRSQLMAPPSAAPPQDQQDQQDDESPRQRLEQLEALPRERLISEEEFTQQRARILGEL